MDLGIWPKVSGSEIIWNDKYTDVTRDFTRDPSVSEIHPPVLMSDPLRSSVSYLSLAKYPPGSYIQTGFLPRDILVFLSHNLSLPNALIHHFD